MLLRGLPAYENKTGTSTGAGRVGRLPKGEVWVMHLAQHHLLPNAGGAPAFACVTFRGEVHGVEARLHPGAYPAFEGTGAWFRLIRHKRGAYTFLERVADKEGTPYPNAK